MAMFSVRVPDDLAGRFDAAADLQGGRSALLRRLILEAAAQPPDGAAGPRGPRSAARIMVRLEARDSASLAAEAARMGLSRSAWVAALVRRRVGGTPTFNRADALALAAVHGELRRVGINVNQIARALNTAVLEGRVLDLELASLAELQQEVHGHMLALREAFEGNLSYWDHGA
jgi:hypothetical protein